MAELIIQTIQEKHAMKKQHIILEVALLGNIIVVIIMYQAVAPAQEHGQKLHVHKIINNMFYNYLPFKFLLYIILFGGGYMYYI